MPENRREGEGVAGGAMSGGAWPKKQGTSPAFGYLPIPGITSQGKSTRRKRGARRTR
jgi:hypothetical protein